MTILDDCRETIQAINANLSAVPVGGKPNAKYGSVNSETGEVEWRERPAALAPGRLFPYFSNAMSVDPEDVPLALDMLKAHGLAVEFDPDGRPKIESSKQHREIAEAMGLFSGRDGFGHYTEDGHHEHTGRVRGEEMKRKRSQMKRIRQELDAMPETVSESTVERVFEKHGGL